ncbi:hypothetical protein B0T16DRAFT_114650 [Cercophora newfieldiana]|uniref:Uncharacterized protein n=1 Tax=Cercophora newfieldiana TaxID=92897 RepID=A0AA40CT26_9PEZI|nr:hypothetical protein B0T16DRAFT_114650 [Cercophora newfieldiana]
MLAYPKPLGWPWRRAWPSEIASCQSQRCRCPPLAVTSSGLAAVCADSPKATRAPTKSSPAFRGAGHANPPPRRPVLGLEAGRATPKDTPRKPQENPKTPRRPKTCVQPGQWPRHGAPRAICCHLLTFSALSLSVCGAFRTALFLPVGPFRTSACPG